MERYVRYFDPVERATRYRAKYEEQKAAMRDYRKTQRVLRGEARRGLQSVIRARLGIRLVGPSLS